MADQPSVMEQAIATRQALEPQRTAGVSSFGPFSALSAIVRSMSGREGTPIAAFSPLTRRLEYNPALSDREEIEATLEHELTHADQRRKRGLFGSILDTIMGGGQSYEDRPYEKEAFASEKNVGKKYRLTDVNLPAPLMSDDEFNRRRAAMIRAMGNGKSR